MSEIEDSQDLQPVQQRSKKRKPKKGLTGRFFIDEAAVSDNEEEQDYYYEDENNIEEGLQKHIHQTSKRERLRAEEISQANDQAQQSHADYVQFDNEMQHQELEKTAKDLTERLRSRYGGISRIGRGITRRAGEYSVVDEESDIATQKLLPSVHDPKLYKVDCLSGKEREMVIQVMELWKKRKNTAKQLFIKSAFTGDVGKGYIYIEADKNVHVREVAYSIRGLFQ